MMVHSCDRLVGSKSEKLTKETFKKENFESFNVIRLHKSSHSLERKRKEKYGCFSSEQRRKSLHQPKQDNQQNFQSEKSQKVTESDNTKV